MKEEIRRNFQRREKMIDYLLFSMKMDKRKLKELIRKEN